MMAQITRFSCQGAAVALVALVSLVGVIVCTILRVPVPEILNVALISSMGAMFGLSVPPSSGPTRTGDR